MKFSSKLVNLLTLFIIGAFSSLNFGFAQTTQVKIWEEDLSLPAYKVDPPEKSPMFFEHDSYQGASKVIYPYPLEDDMTNTKITKTLKAVYLENEFLKVCVLPEIGGRLFYATDKTNDYEIFYRQHVIKPAHIGMVGAWISGGIEFCVFHHHRASTNMPVDYKLETYPDGHVTLWIGETEPRHRMKWTFGISLYPEKSYLELDGRMINVTENVNSILYWANVATHVNDEYQIIFPPSTAFATFHSKNTFSHWPITKESFRGNEYYKNNIDASWWKNHPGPNSFFAHDIKDGFLAGYDHGKKAGTMLVANPHIVKGAKLWEWGKGSVWDTKVLTDNDGPYAEIMSGAYSDNQPDYSWIKPYELKKFKQFWYPMRESQGATMANLNGLLNLKKLSDGRFFIAANTTSLNSNAKLLLEKEGNVLWEKIVEIAPNLPFNQTIVLNDDLDKNDLTLSLYNSEHELLISSKPIESKASAELPEPVSPPLPPSEIDNQEELYLTGLRIKQFHNARLDPTDYFLNALERDPYDSRCNTQMGIYYKEKGVYDKASFYLRKAIKRITKNYTRPRDCEAFYYLGNILKQQGKYAAAYDTLYRAAWDHTYTSPAYFQLAQISTFKKDYSRAQEELEISLSNNGSNLNALNLKVTILRKLEKYEEAIALNKEVLDQDPLNFWAYNERALLTKKKEDQQWESLLRNAPESYLELAVTYLNAGFLDEAKQVLLSAINSSNKDLARYPTISYYLGYLSHLEGDSEKSTAHFKNGETYSTDYCFPYRLESEKVYLTALDYNSNDARAYYYLGNLLYDKQPERAITYWEKAVESDPKLAIAQRNIGWGYNQTYKDLDKAILAYESAITHDKGQSRYYLELDRLYEKNGSSVEKRAKVLTENHATVAQLNTALIREIQVLVGIGDYDTAIEYLTTFYFSRKEGGQNLHDLYVDAMLLRGKAYIEKKQYDLAFKDFLAADEYPENQSIGRDEDSERRAQIYFYCGLANEKLGNKVVAKDFYMKATAVKVKKELYNYEKALALNKLGEVDQANKLFNNLYNKGNEMLNQAGEVDFFSKFGGRETENIQQSYANHLIGLGHVGMGNPEKGKLFFNSSLKLDPGNYWSKNCLLYIK